MAKTFPKDCTKDCPYYHYWDMSIDDYTNVCDKLDVQVDDCDAYSPFYIPLFCPLEKEPTAKQIKYATYLAERMGIDLPKECTKEAYSNFISKWKPAVDEEDKAMNAPNSWQMQYM